MNLSIPKLARGFSIALLGFRSSPLARGFLPACALLTSMAMTAVANAKAPDGVYKFTSGKGTIEVGGQPFVLSKARLKEIASVHNGSVTIKNGMMTLDRDAARNIFKDIVEIDPKITIKGPSSIIFKKSGTSFIAATPKPVVVNLKAEVSGDELAGVLRTRYDSKVKNGNLTINVKFAGTIGFVGSVNQQKIEGSASIICDR